MAVPNSIANGQNPSGTKLKENFDYLFDLVSGGQALKSDTYANLKAAALAAPTTVFLGVATTEKLLLLYTGDATAGDAGFVVLADWSAAPDTTEVG